MKKLLLLIAPVILLSFSTAEGISKKEKKAATKLLKQTKKEIVSSVKGLNDAQLKFKPAADAWSVEECLKHIAMTEQALWGMLDASLKQGPAPAKRSEVKMTDEEVVKSVEDRTTKRKTSDPLKPENTPFKTADDALSSFQQSRDKLVEFTNMTEADLRNHIIAMPFGSLDAYQFILFIAAHSNRHMQQIMEVKANPAFPKL